MTRKIGYSKIYRYLNANNVEKREEEKVKLQEEFETYYFGHIENLLQNIDENGPLRKFLKQSASPLFEKVGSWDFNLDPYFHFTTTTDEQSGISASWEKLLDEIRKDRISVYAFLCEGKPIRVNHKLRIEFNPRYRFHKEALKKKENREFLESKISQICGPCEVEIGLTKET